MQQRSRGPPAPLPVAGQAAGSHIAIASAACCRAGPRRTRLSHASAQL